MRRPFLVIALVCLALFVVAGLFAGELLPYLGQSSHSVRARRPPRSSIWPIIQNVSAVLGIVAFLIQIAQWGRKRD